MSLISNFRPFDFWLTPLNERLRSPQAAYGPSGLKMIYFEEEIILQDALQLMLKKVFTKVKDFQRLDQFQTD